MNWYGKYKVAKVIKMPNNIDEVIERIINDLMSLCRNMMGVVRADYNLFGSVFTDPQVLKKQYSIVNPYTGFVVDINVILIETDLAAAFAHPPDRLIINAGYIYKIYLALMQGSGGEALKRHFRHILHHEIVHLIDPKTAKISKERARKVLEERERFKDDSVASTRVYFNLEPERDAFQASIIKDITSYIGKDGGRFGIISRALRRGIDGLLSVLISFGLIFKGTEEYKYFMHLRERSSQARMFMQRLYNELQKIG